MRGRLVWQWQCGRCQAMDSDSRRALALLRKPCTGHHGVVLEKAPHVWVDTGSGPTRSRCNLVCGNGRVVEAAGQVCPVMACTRQGAPWPEGEASLARELGKLHGFRRWCETPLIEVRSAGAWAEGAPRGAARVAGSGLPAEALLALGVCTWLVNWGGSGSA